MVARLFPKRTLASLDSDSSLFRAYVPLNKVRVRKNDDEILHIPPQLRAIHLGCRPAVILSEVDLNCSWDVVNRPIEGGLLYHKDDGLLLGTNIITAVLANFQYARAWGQEKRYPEQNDKSRDQLVIAQIVHGGDWDPTPHALPNLMKYIRSQTTLDVQFKREVVRLSNPEAFNHPVLYMTGLRDFRFSDAAVARLRTYLKSGGMLIADAAAGNTAFDKAFRREILRVLPKNPMKGIELDSPVYQTPYEIKTVEYTDVVKATHPKLNIPTLEGIELDRQLSVIYSPLGFACGWEQLGFAYNNGYSDLDALRLGVNLFTYSLTH
jgi:hypothetical protein